MRSSIGDLRSIFEICHTHAAPRPEGCGVYDVPWFLKTKGVAAKK
jgi:hypothetical protein